MSGEQAAGGTGEPSAAMCDVASCQNRALPGDIVCANHHVVPTSGRAASVPVRATPQTEEGAMRQTCICRGLGATQGCPLHWPNADASDIDQLVNDGDPEDFCQRCGRPNVVWFAPNDLWNLAVPGGGILCPVCFVQVAEEAGIVQDAWCVIPERRLPRAALAAPPSKPLADVRAAAARELPPWWRRRINALLDRLEAANG